MLYFHHELPFYTPRSYHRKHRSGLDHGGGNQPKSIVSRRIRRKVVSEEQNSYRTITWPGPIKRRAVQRMLAEPNIQKLVPARLR